MRLELVTLGLAFLVTACAQSPAPPAAPSDRSARLEIDGVRLFVPIAWASGRPWDQRPWPNGAQIGSGGWGQFEPQLGPIALSQELPRGRMYRASTNAPPPRPASPDPFFQLIVTFEFPLPPPRRTWWGGTRQERAFPFSLDRLRLTYRSAAEKVQRRYVDLLSGISREDGEDVGGGWREVRRQFENRQLSLRFDASEWRAHGGPLPRRLAASFYPGMWSHFVSLNRERWTAEFDTQDLPTRQWSARYETTEQLFEWLQTPPERRDNALRFRWWSDFRFRPQE